MLAWLAALWREGKFCDVQVRVENSVYDAHRLVLSAGSTFMCSLFEGVFADSTSPVVDLGEMTVAAFEMALLYLYDGSCGLPEENLLGPVLAAASRLGIAPLLAAATNEMQRRLSSATCVRALICAELYLQDSAGLVSLHKAAAAAEEVNFVEVVESGELSVLPALAVRSVLGQHVMNVVDEADVFHGICVGECTGKTAARR